MKNIIQFVGTALSSCVFQHEELSRFMSTHEAVWLKEDEVLEFVLTEELGSDALNKLRSDLSRFSVDVFYFPLENRCKKLLLADMDATIVTSETLDDLAAYIGIGEEISRITAKAMAGELDFEEALKARVSRLKEVPVSVLDDVYRHMSLSAGARALVQVMRQAGAKCVLVSGGLTYFTARIAEQCGFHKHHGNILDVRDGVLTGYVDAPILDKNAKKQFLETYALDLGVSLVDTAAVGDGANDLPMLQTAGLGVGYHPKPLVREQVCNSIIYSDLTSLLYMQGYCWDDVAPYMKN